ncbi:aminopeptidase P family protein [Vibrio tapetis subsp. quintayensis]|uniref:aminopeptidase P family protein n=1 Tax=Vibrio tapetis TaxID=52443 RepID=UPI0025B5AFA5|nr:aminopeptidase P family protein [Vibrio tapetis]MDN3679638.1 aminopeptidase P family protein [Vibrio tapetis subsp. quintayensis]
MHSTITQKVESLRNWLIENQYDAFIIPHEDEFLGEYIPAHNERLHWATGFTGSAGAAVITPDRAAVFVDGRYTVQVTKQVPSDIFEYCHLIETPPIDWICSELKQGAKVAVDARMHSANWLNNSQQKLIDNGEVCILGSNPIDILWHDRPEAKFTDASLMSEEKSGLSSTAKRAQIAKELIEQKADAALLTQLDSICWLLNVRGLDVSRLPVLLSHAIIYNTGNVDFFIDSTRLPAEFDQHVGNGVSVFAPSELEARLATMTGKQVLVDPATSNAWFTLVLQNAGAELIEAADPCLLIKAAKNPVELAGMKACHIRDGAAMTKFLSWLDSEVDNGKLHNEAHLSDTLQGFREEDPTLVDLSFDTISAAGGNAAMCHYNHNDQPQPGQLSLNSLYLVDSGGQYPDGTTDITRTIAIGQPSDDMKQQFTLVLKGHIGLTTALFPKGTTGHQLDVLARQPLWSQGYNYDHGTGHGVGHFLSVHEGPQRIAPAVNTVALLEGMVLSNEPGYYRADAFGIRIENLEVVKEVATNGDMSMLGFESLTRCPIDKRCINVNMLTRPELEWLNSYHQKVWDEVSPLVSGEPLNWLKQATAALSYPEA